MNSVFGACMDTEREPTHTLWDHSRVLELTSTCHLNHAAPGVWHVQ